MSRFRSIHDMGLYDWIELVVRLSSGDHRVGWSGVDEPVTPSMEVHGYLCKVERYRDCKLEDYHDVIPETIGHWRVS